MFANRQLALSGGGAAVVTILLLLIVSSDDEEFTVASETVATGAMEAEEEAPAERAEAAPQAGGTEEAAVESAELEAPAFAETADAPAKPAAEAESKRAAEAEPAEETADGPGAKAAEVDAELAAAQQAKTNAAMAASAAEAAALTNALVYDTKADVEAVTVPASGRAIKTNGFYSVGDDGAALYKRVATDPGHSLKIVDASGAFFELVPENGAINARQAGAVGDGVADDTAALQAAIDFEQVVILPRGTYRTTAPIILSLSGAALIGQNHGYSGDTASVIDYTGSDAAIKVEDTSDSRAASVRVEHLGIAVRAANARGIDFRHAIYSRFQNLWIRLYGAGQAAVYGVGNGLGSAPYYNRFLEVDIFGQGDGTKYPNQIGYVFEGDGAGKNADGPNGNVISNAGRIAGVSKAIRIKSGNGNMFSQIGFEAIQDYIFHIGDAAARAAGRADGNIASNFRNEGNNTAILAWFEGDADRNLLTNYYTISMNRVLFKNDAKFGNFCKPTGSIYVADFYGEDIPAKATTVLSPVRTGPEGGIAVPINGIPYAVIATTNRFAPGGNGSAAVKLYRTGTLHEELQTVVDANNRIVSKVWQTAPDSTQTYNNFKDFNGIIQVEVETDAAWDQTSADIHVQVVFLL